MLSQLGLPDVDPIVFEHSPLVFALCQIRFGRVLGVADPAFVASFQQAMAAQYPITFNERQIQLTSDGGDSEPFVRRAGGQDVWRFVDADDQWAVVLAQDFVALEARTYERFADFKARLSLVLTALVEHIRPQFGIRVGLRHINEIRGDYSNWAEVIRPELCGLLAADPFQRQAERAFYEVALKYPESYGLTLRHGLFPQGTSVEPGTEAPDTDNPFYLLDFDAFRDMRPNEVIPLDPEALCEEVGVFSRAIDRFFCWSISKAHH